jgi:tetratricopeptide (TPR) repeat protein
MPSRRSQLAFAALVIGLSVGQVAPAQTAREVARHALASVVVILAENDKGKAISLGSGFFVTDGVVVTNYHVIKGAARLRVKLVGLKQVYRIDRILMIDTNADLALLRVGGVRAPMLTLGDDSRIAAGDEVYVAGNPEGLEGTFSKGVISGVRSSKGRRYLQITAPISPGSSGGPVLNAAGEVIGIAVASLRTGQNLNFAIPASYVRSLLSRAFAGFTNEIATVEKQGVTEPAKTGWLTPPSPSEIKNLSELQNKVRSNPKSPEANLNLAEFNRQHYRRIEAIQSYKRAIELKPGYAEAHYGLAEAYSMYVFSALIGPQESVQQVTLAVEAYKQAIRMKPDYVEAHIGLGQSYSSLKRYEEAIAAFGVAIRLNPEARDAYFSLGSTYSEMERYTEAVDAYKQVARINPDSSVTLALIANLLRVLERYDEAIRYGTLAIQGNSSGSVGTGWFELVELYRETGHIREGITDFGQIIVQMKAELGSLKSDGFHGIERVERTRKLAYAYCCVGLLYVDLGDKASALEQYKAIKTLGNCGPCNSLANDLFNAVYK